METSHGKFLLVAVVGSLGACSSIGAHRLEVAKGFFRDAVNPDPSTTHYSATSLPMHPLLGTLYPSYKPRFAARPARDSILAALGTGAPVATP